MKHRIRNGLLHVLGAIGIVVATEISAADTIRIATWNLNNLHFKTHQALRNGAPARSTHDYKTLGYYAARLKADVIALQEANGPRAAKRVFPPNAFDLYFSGRHLEDTKQGRKSDRIYTGFAVRRGVFESVDKGDYQALSVKHDNRYRTRWGVSLTLRRDGRALHLLNVHLKSGCFTGALKRPRDANCATLARQLRPLETWIDERAANGDAFVVLGDFNRALDVHQDRDHFWQALNDGEPAALSLYRYPFRKASACWQGTERHHRNPIDFFVVDGSTFKRVVRNSFQQWRYQPGDRDITRGTPSDHCPASIDITW
ncbi:MAG: endonuclease/exonuclease/phosphatase family protein [Pseudomonadota bacterium]